MQIEMLEKVLRAAKALDISIDLRPNYSGRGMFGSTTYAFAAPQNDVKAIENDVGVRFVWDSMGHDIVAY